MTAKARKFTFSLASAVSMSASLPGLFTNETEICFAVCIVRIPFSNQRTMHVRSWAGACASRFDLMRQPRKVNSINSHKKQEKQKPATGTLPVRQPRQKRVESIYSGKENVPCSSRVESLGCFCPVVASGAGTRAGVASGRRSGAAGSPAAADHHLAAASLPASASHSPAPATAGAACHVQDRLAGSRCPRRRSGGQGAGVAIVREHRQPADGSALLSFHCPTTGPSTA